MTPIAKKCMLTYTHAANMHAHNPYTTYIHTCIHLVAALDCIRFLVEQDCDLFLGDKAGALCIHHAAAHNKVDVVRFFVQHGLSKEVTQTDGKTPMHVVSIRGL